MAGNCTRIVAEHIIATISPPITSASYILDNACGPGTVSEQIKHLHPDAKVMATDLNEGMIKEVEKQIRVKGWTNMQTGLSDIKSLHNMPDATFTHAITNFGMCASGNSESGLKAFKELFRVLQVGGVAVVTTWAGICLPFISQCLSNANSSTITLRPCLAGHLHRSSECNSTE